MDRIKYQQGDVLLKEIKSYGLSEEFSAKKIKKGRKLDHLVLAEGEVTGHVHQITAGVAELVILGNTTLLKVLSDYAKLKHDTHDEIEIPKGDYVIDIVKEYDEIEERRVAD
jgi:hypothetical protein